MCPKRSIPSCRESVILYCVVAVVFCTTIFAGPPAICHPIDIGAAKSLPWGPDAFSQDGSYDRNHVEKDTIEILKSSDSALVHMETLRRAILYIQGDSANAARLLSAMMARALDAEACGKPSPLAWFDAGYFAQILHQMDMGRSTDSRIDVGVAEDVAGYGWIRKAIELDPDNAELQFGAAVVTVLKAPKLTDMHAQRARETAPPDSLVLSNLARHESGAWQHLRGREN